MHSFVFFVCVWSSLSWCSYTPHLLLLTCIMLTYFTSDPESYTPQSPFLSYDNSPQSHGKLKPILVCSFYCHTFFLTVIQTQSIQGAWHGLFSILSITVIRHHEKRVTHKNLFCTHSFLGLYSNSCNNLNQMLGLVLSSESHIIKLWNNLFVQCEYVLLSLV